MTHEVSPVPLAEVIGRAVRDVRRSRGPHLTQERLAELLQQGGLDWSRNVIANLENGRLAKIDVRDVLAVARTLAVSPLDLLAPERGEGDEPLSIEVWRGMGYPAEIVRLWLMGAVATPWDAHISPGGQVEESLARQLAEAAFLKGSSLRDLRVDLAALPEDMSVEDPVAGRRRLRREIQSGMAKLQAQLRRLEELEELEEQESHGDD